MEWLKENAGLIIEVFMGLFIVGNWIWDKFIKAHRLMKSNEDFHEKVNKHDKEIKEVNEKFDKLLTKVDDLTEVIKIQLRYNIVSACNEVIERGYIDQYQLQSIEDMYSVYSGVLHANSYVTTLIMRVRKLPIKNVE